MIPFWINWNTNLCRYGLFIVVLSSFVLAVSSNTALLVVDVQNCFLPGGSLAVTDADEIIPVINNIRRKHTDLFTLTVFTQDWHCADHVSFASQHTGHSPFDVVILQYDENGNLCNETSSSTPCTVEKSINQTLWPDHCVINTTGAQFSDNIHRKPTDIVVKKGYHCEIDSYSGFYDNGGFTKTELEAVLQSHEIETVVIVGLALDYCVYFTALDARRVGYNVYVVVDASRPVSPADKQTVVTDMDNRGIHVVNSTELRFLVSSSTSFNICFYYCIVCFILVYIASSIVLI
ncbi:NAD(+) salvage pathway protein [Mactra antiquata]